MTFVAQKKVAALFDKGLETTRPPENVVSKKKRAKPKLRRKLPMQEAIRGGCKSTVQRPFVTKSGLIFRGRNTEGIFRIVTAKRGIDYLHRAIRKCQIFAYRNQSICRSRMFVQGRCWKKVESRFQSTLELMEPCLSGRNRCLLLFCRCPPR